MELRTKSQMGRGKEGVEQGRGQGPLAEEGGLDLDICVGVSEFQLHHC